MKFALNEGQGNVIKSWQQGEIIINEQKYQQNMIISANRLILQWQVDFKQLSEADLTDFYLLKPELIILGSGETQIFPPQSLFIKLFNQGIGLEVMTSRTACHTYNILSNEGRHVVAGILV